MNRNFLIYMSMVFFFLTVSQAISAWEKNSRETREFQRAVLGIAPVAS